jgi:hypothetical protein
VGAPLNQSATPTIAAGFYETVKANPIYSRPWRGALWEIRARHRSKLKSRHAESAKRHAPTVFAPGVVMRPGLEVILRDARGREIWRGPYLGRDGAI